MGFSGKPRLDEANFGFRTLGKNAMAIEPLHYMVLRRRRTMSTLIRQEIR
jgi:hypothetical protein|tara:strand:+ start:325 stop:474 length:150 start_codon:yes stop_codon:yes gene_type:complete